MKRESTTTATKKLLILTTLFVMILVGTITAQPIIQWQKSMGGSGYEEMATLKQTVDGGYIIAGASGSTNGDYSANTTNLSGVVIKYDANGNLIWQNFYNGYISSIQQTPDLGYVMMCGRSIIKLDPTGAIQWQSILHGFACRAVSYTTNGDYIVVGADSGIAGNGIDFYIAKINSIGNLLWQKTYGGSMYDGATSMSLTPDGGCIAVGFTNSPDGDVTGYHGGSGGSTANTPFSGDCWVIKIDSIGTLQWQRALGGSQDDISYYSSVLLSNTKGYFIGCATKSYDGDVTGFKGGLGDCWIINLDSLGQLIWQKTFGGKGGESLRSMCFTNDNGILFTGLTGSNNNGDVAGYHGQPTDAWLVKIDTIGNIIYQKCLGGTGAERGFDVVTTTDGGCAIGGNCNRANGDVTDNKGSYDGWIIKLGKVKENAIKGIIYEDLNANCIKDSNEVGLSGRLVSAMPGNYFASSDNNGNYTLFVDTGFYVVCHIPPNFYNQSCSISSGTYNVNITSLLPNSFGNDFADTLNNYCADVKVSVGTTSLRRCFKNNYSIAYANIGSVNAINTTITVNFDPAIIPLISTIPWTVIGGQYVFTIDTIKPGQGGNIIITDSVSCTALFAVLKCVNATISSSTFDCNLKNNDATDCHFIIGSFDPNGMEVASQNINNGYVLQENINATDTLSYLIKFQNTGSDTAQTVVVRDTLSNFLNASTIELGATSHPYTFRIYDQGICEWTFNNINLPYSASNELMSHGFIKFNIKQKTGNSPGTTITNSASIWFDFNQFIYTNSTVNIIQAPTNINQISLNNNVLIYPNPFSKSATLISNTELKDAQLLIYNMLGEKINNINNISTQQVIIERNNLISGIYFYSLIQKEKIIAKGKIIIE